MLDEVRQQLDAFALNVISQAKRNLAKNDNTGRLKNSLDYEVTQDKNDIGLTFYGEDYANFLDKGVQGNDPSKMPKGSKSRYNKAPNSPYQFGSGKGKKGLRKSIDRWVTQRGGFKVRDDKGRFIPRKSMVYLITRSIWYTGLRGTEFFTSAVNQYQPTLAEKLADAFGKDGAKIIRDGIKDINTNGR